MMLTQTLFNLLATDIFAMGNVGGDLMFGLKIVALVMLYGYMHMNLGGGILSTGVFLIFAYFFLFMAEGILAVAVLAVFFFTIHGFDIIWGGDIVKGNVEQIRAGKMAAVGGERAMMHRMRPPP